MKVGRLGGAGRKEGVSFDAVVGGVLYRRAINGDVKSV